MRPGDSSFMRNSSFWFICNMSANEFEKSVGFSKYHQSIHTPVVSRRILFLYILISSNVIKEPCHFATSFSCTIGYVQVENVPN